MSCLLHHVAWTVAILNGLIADGFYLSDKKEVVEDDITVHRQPMVIQQLSTQANVTAYWESRQIPFYLDAGIKQDRTSNSSVFAAISIIHEKTHNCVEFFQTTTTDIDYINITNANPGCYSSIGKVGGQQVVNIGPGCVTVGIIMHELLHVLGFWHEHSRTDRDKYIVIYYENISVGRESEFVKQNSTSALEAALEAAFPYDFHSILHYKSNQFAKVKTLDTIVPAVAFGYVNKTVLGQREVLSNMDVEKIMWLYQCGKYKVNTCMPIELRFGVVSPKSSQYSAGSIVTLKCETGFLIGATTSQCLANGRWSNQTPFCIQVNQSEFFYCDMEEPCLKLFWDSLATSGHLANWKRHSGISGITGTGPTNDHTLQNATGSYLLMDTSGVPPGQPASVLSHRLSLSSTENLCLMFWYYIHGSDMGTMEVYINWQRLWQTSSNANSANWEPVVVQYHETNISYIRLLFHVIVGNGEKSDIALDDVIVGPCSEVSRYRNLFH